MPIYVVGTFDTKGLELRYIRDLIERAGASTLLVDVGTLGDSEEVDVNSQIVAKHHPNEEVEIFNDDRGEAVTQMSIALKHFIGSRTDIEGIISAGGSGGTALVTPAMRTLPVGTPKVMISTVASGNVEPYVGPNDICMIYSITDIQGLNRISRKVLANAAHAIAGMVKSSVPEVEIKPAIGLSMFGVTTPCIQAVVKELESDFDCLVFHATGTGGQSMEKLVESGLVKGLIDATTTEVCDLLMGGIFSAGEDRLGSIIRTELPYVGSCGALDMVNFGARDTVPDKYKERQFHVHNANVTLMRTTVEENKNIGEWLADKLNQMQGEVRFLVPLKGVSSLDSEEHAFHNPEADAALFDALEKKVIQTDRRKLIKLNHNINDPEFSTELVKQFKAII
ncbi:MAG: Tm-1-like ATP-binding domain-containing protein [Rhodobacteraceae bacterium]|nr:Tm-1-like ATP-binding domain-containing protein [Paracoccaceae bacterium]